MALPTTSVQENVSTGEMTQADLNDLRTGTGPDLSGDEFRNMESSRYDGTPRGYSQADQPYTEENLPPEPQQVYQPEPETPVENFQQKYGQSENEKGEWRRMALQAQEQNQMLANQLAEISNRLTQPAQPQQPQGPPPRLFPDKQPGELLTFGEMEDILINDVLPTIEQRAQLAANQAQDWSTARAQRMQSTWDVSSQEELQALNALRGSISNFDNRFTATEQNQMIMNQVQLNRSSQPNLSVRPTATPVGRVQQPPVLVDANKLMRKQTYIESSAPAQMQSEPSTTVSVQTRFQQDLDALDAEAQAKTGRKATPSQLKSLLVKYGVSEVNDWGIGTSSR
jgi:hypothetical protein